MTLDNLLGCIVKIEETNRYRCGYMFEITIKEKDVERTFYFDLNHRFSINDGKIRFEKNRKPMSREFWDYRKEPFEAVVISVMPRSNGFTRAKEIGKLLQAAYAEHERKWKEETSDLNLNKKELLL